MLKVRDVRPSPIAGSWYSADPKELTGQIKNYVTSADSYAVQGRVVGLVAPHAGHRYSGRTAGYAYRTVFEQTYDLVIVVGPLHSYFPAPILTSAHKYYETPLGKVAVAQEYVDKLNGLLVSQGMAELYPLANDEEHSIEIQLPFLQYCLADSFELLPVMVRPKNLTLTNALGTALNETIRGRSALLVASTDLSHFYSVLEAFRFDHEMLSQVEKFSPAGVLKAEENGSGFACGAGALASVMAASRASGADTAKVLHYSTSANETGDSSSVVGYGAAVFFERE